MILLDLKRTLTLTSSDWVDFRAGDLEKVTESITTPLNLLNEFSRQLA